MKYKYILFDADNTLLDFDKCEYEAFKLTVEKAGLQYSEEISAKYHVINEALWKALERGETTQAELRVERFARLLAEIGEDSNRGDELNEAYMGFLATMRFMLSDAVEVVKTLSEHYSLYIITNGLSRVQHGRLGGSLLAPYFKGMFVSEDIGVTKPHRGYFEHVMREIGSAEPSDYLVIGDSLTSDIKGALNAGMDSVWYNPEGKESNGTDPTYIISRLSELYDLL